jgi:ABC-2 type transport system permease protein
VGTLPLLVLAVGIVGVTDYLLDVSVFMFVVSVLTIAMMTFAVAGLAIGFGTLFPQFETENAAQIPTSFGGLLFMMSSIAVIAGVVILEARPVYSYLASRTFTRAQADPTEMVVGFGLAALLCVAATIVPIRIALNRLETLER